MLQKSAKLLLLQLNDERNNYGNEAPPLRSAGLSFLFTLCRSECILLCCRLLKVVTMSQLRKITSFLFLFELIMDAPIL